MTREEFMKHAEEEIDLAFSGRRNRLKNLVEQAWAEGKRNAETEGISAIVQEAITRTLTPAKWRVVDDDIHCTYECSACGKWTMSPSDYCPGCGRKMEEIEK